VKIKIFWDNLAEKRSGVVTIEEVVIGNLTGVRYSPQERQYKTYDAVPFQELQEGVSLTEFLNRTIHDHSLGVCIRYLIGFHLVFNPEVEESLRVPLQPCGDVFTT